MLRISNEETVMEKLKQHLQRCQIILPGGIFERFPALRGKLMVFDKATIFPYGLKLGCLYAVMFKEMAKINARVGKLLMRNRRLAGLKLRLCKKNKKADYVEDHLFYMDPDG